MSSTIKNFWNYISHLGTNDSSKIEFVLTKRQIFFNRCLFIGFFSLLSNIPSSIPFIGNYAFLNLISLVAVVIALFVHSKGKFAVAKRVFVYSIFVSGGLLTALSGGDFLYHIGAITVLIFSWVIFNPKEELPELILFTLITFSLYIIGEYNLFNAPDFTNHPQTQVARLANLIAYTILIVLFVNFILSLNKIYEKRLINIIEEKDLLVKK